jgi:hypothetical protein
MIDLHNALLAAYLDGEPASVAILNDYLLEQGDDPRKLHGNAMRRFRVVLGLISPQLSHPLGCDFAEHVADYFERARPNDDTVRNAIELKRRWLRGDATAEELKSVRNSLLQMENDWVHGRRYANSARHVVRAAFCACTFGKHTARDCSAPAARAAFHASLNARDQERESHWQLDRLRQVLLTGSADDVFV